MAVINNFTNREEKVVDERTKNGRKLLNFKIAVWRGCSYGRTNKDQRKRDQLRNLKERKLSESETLAS